MMTTVTTRNQQAKMGSAVRRVGGIGHFLALTQEKRKKVQKGEQVEILKASNGKWVVRATKRRRRGQITGKIVTLRD